MNYLLLSAILLLHSPIVSSTNTTTSLSSANETAMPRRPVRSSNIASIGYDAGSNTLEVEFVTGAVYQYYNVPQSVYEGLMNAHSHGTYLAAQVKDVYRFQEIR